MKNFEELAVYADYLQSINHFDESFIVKRFFDFEKMRFLFVSDIFVFNGYGTGVGFGSINHYREDFLFCTGFGNSFYYIPKNWIKLQPFNDFEMMESVNQGYHYYDDRVLDEIENDDDLYPKINFWYVGIGDGSCWLHYERVYFAQFLTSPDLFYGL